MKYLQPFLIAENVQQAKSFLTKKGISLNDPNFLKIREMIGNNVGYVFWFTKRFFEDKVPMEELENVWNIIKTEPQIISKFETPVVNLENLEKFWDEYLNKKGQNQARSSYNEFPSEQKRLINLKSEEDLKLLTDLYNDKEKSLFIKKISRYHNRKQLLDNLKLFLYSKSENKFNTLLKSLQQHGVNIKYANEENDIIVVTVNYPQIRIFGADTSWCIVGSEYTFQSYNNQPLSQQFIIFLLDKTDIYSKIGVTSNIKGIYTAHLKNDSYVNPNKVIKILKDRDVDTSILYPSKKSALEIDWSFTPTGVLKEIGFTEEEIYSKKRNDISNLDWSGLSVEFLLGGGFTKEEIVKKKNLFGNYQLGKPKKTDLEYFTKEEIEKWGLLDRTKLDISDLKSYTKEEIVKKHLLDRVVNISIVDLGGLGFNFIEIRNFAKTPKFRNNELSTLINGKTREQVLRFITDTFMSSLPIKIKYESRDQYRMRLIKLVDLKEDDIPFERLYGSFNRTKTFDSAKSAIRYFGSIYKMDINKIKKIIFDFSRKYIEVLASFINQDFYKDICIKLLDSAIDTFSDLKYYNYKNMEIIENYIGKEFPELYQRIYDKVKSYLFGRYIETYNLKVKLESRSGSGETNVKGTIKNLDFWNAQSSLTIDDIGSIFNDIGVSSAGDVLEYCKKHGIEFGDKAYEFVKKIKNYHDSTLEFLKFCIENSIAVDKCYDDLFEYMRDKRGKMNDWDKEKIKYLLAKRDDFEERWEAFENQDLINEAISETKGAAEYCWSRSRNPVKPEDWYQKYWPIIKKLDFDKINATHDSWDDVTFVSTVVLLAKIGKMDEMKDIKHNIIKGPNYTNRGFRYLTKIIADKEITNWKRTFMKLDYDQRKSIFEWLDKQVDTYIKNNWENSQFVISLMLIDWYIFDKEKLNRYIEVVKKMKNNYKYYGRKDVERYKTLRLAEVEKLLNYLAEEGKFEDIENILSQFKLTKQERKDSQDIGKYTSLFYSRKEGDDLYNREAEKEHRQKYTEILKKYLSEPVKESFILRWNDFRNI
jgi:hypothetical protein